ncbi:MAG: porphobilinogen synthase [Calditrichaeota bacterium]|nr:porphobilinogen synthase [Calditrichota bacterium]
MGFPVDRLRRLRRTANLRRMVQETQLSVSQLIYPLFVCPGQGVRREVPSMPGVFQLSTDQDVEEARRTADLGIPAVILFGIPEEKDATGSDAYSETGIIQRATEAIKKTVPDLIVIDDLCFCEYTDHGHCGIIRDGDVDNDATLEIIGKTAVAQARAGADIVAPSGMMDGAVAAIRSALDEAGFPNVAIMAYAAKYASAFYGPFRDAAESAPQFGDRRAYQMNPANRREAMLEILFDDTEGADILMVKPALAYLDIIREARDRVLKPVAAYNVSGEYSMVKAAARLGWVDEERIVPEILIAIRRAGADLIITYFAQDVARRWKDGIWF